MAVTFCIHVSNKVYFEHTRLTLTNLYSPRLFGTSYFIAPEGKVRVCHSGNKASTLWIRTKSKMLRFNVWDLVSTPGFVLCLHLSFPLFVTITELWASQTVQHHVAILQRPLRSGVRSWVIYHCNRKWISDVLPVTML